MDILTAEERMAQWIESVTGMTGKVYRIALPRGVREGIEVKLISGRPRTVNQLNEFTIEIRGISPDRRTLWGTFEKIFAAVPLHKYGSVVYADIKDDVHFSLDEKEGMQLFAGKVMITAAFA